MGNVIFPESLQAGTFEDIGDVDANLKAIRDVVNGLLDGGNIADSSIQAADLAAGSVTEKAWKPQNGLVRPFADNVTSDGPPSSSWANAGSSPSISVTPAVACYMLIQLRLAGNVSGGDGSNDNVVEATIAVDGGAEDTAIAKIMVPRTISTAMYQTGAQQYRVPLTAAAHTVQLRFRKPSGKATGSIVTSLGISASWVLVAQ